ncbi:OLC1v1021545C2 [Oldenlandia corymbosa var. corymbosa]|uniref:OLC1v1021545C2 n=2 Tax=Oldenlandia corymbosa var. corymbosa TaxID=529605 RepID=A0AAV1BVX2_OLDCO|nr:OLC1v1021545C2 [Oldenlandia corymbosa var. corymbosa]
MQRLQSLNRRLSSLNRCVDSINWRLNPTQSFCSCQIVNNGNNRRKPGEKRKEKETLYSKISPLGNPSIKVTPVIDQWVESGKRVRFAEILRIIHDLRKRNRFSQALEVSEWMENSGLYAFTPTEHAVRLDLIGRVHGYLSAETYFNKLTEQDKTEKTYGALLHCYVRQREVGKSLSHLQTMKEKRICLSAVAYNDIMSLYTNVGQHEKVPDVLNRMKANGVTPDNLSYRICINSYGVRSDFDGMEKVLREMENQPGMKVDWNTYAVVANFYIKAGREDEANSYLVMAEMKLEKKDNLGYNHLISLHAHLGNKDQVLWLWKLQKQTSKCINRDYINVLKSLVRLGEFELAEELLKGWELSGNCYDFRLPLTIIDGYIKKGLCKMAEAKLRNLMNKGKATTPSSWERLSAGYLEMDEPVKASECMKIAVSFEGKHKGWKPDPRVLAKLVDFSPDQLGGKDSDESLSFNSVMPESR